MRVIEIPFGSVGIDCLTPITAAVAQEIAAYRLPGTRTGITFVDRYLENVTAGELAGLFAASLGVAFIGEGRTTGWNVATGSLDAQRELARARTLGLPVGSSPLLSIGCDLEGMVDCTPADASAYATAYGHTIAGAAYAPEGYIGDNVPLTPAQLYAQPFAGYWRSLSNVQPIAGVDYYKLQAYPSQTIQLASGPFQVDLNFVVRDKKLRLPSMVVGA